MKKAVLLLLLLMMTACGKENAAGEHRVVYPGVAPADYQPETAAYDPPPRYYPEATLKLLPSEDYGPIYPYLGFYGNRMGRGDIVVEEDGSRNEYPGQFFYDRTLFGLCTADGVILCEPTYQHAYTTEHDGKALYVLTHPGQSVTLAALDGSFAEEYDQALFSNRTVYGHENGVDFDFAPLTQTPYITVCREGKWGLVDYECREILPLIYQNPLYFTGKYAPVLNGDGTYSYIDIQGHAALGPYPAPEEEEITLHLSEGNISAWAVEQLAFNNGRAILHRDGKYGMIDESGAIIAEPQYDSVSLWHGGSARVVDDTGAYWTDFGGNRLPADQYWRVGPGVFQSGDGWCDIQGQLLDPDLREYQYLGDGCALWRVPGAYEIRRESEIVLSLPWNQPEGQLPYMKYSGGSLVTPDGLMDLEGSLTPWPDQTSQWEYPSIGIPWPDGFMAVSDGKWGGLIDPDGNWVLRLPMHDIFID